MKRFSIKVLLVICICDFFLADDEYNFKTFKNDVLDTHYLEFKNGLKTYLVKNTKTPTVEVRIVYKVGSKHDPQDNTGLAHYLEHMMFKGTDKIGVIDYEKEKQILDKIEDLFERHKIEIDEKKKEENYKEIDKLSVEASNYSIANEFENMLKSLGATGINAITYYDGTAFTLNIPNNNLEKIFKIMSEQLTKPVFRRFHSELESVYEEYVRNKEDAHYEVWNMAFTELFQNHTYKNPVIGKSEHLKNPSVKAIKEQFEKYYVPNNCCIILVGDIDYIESAKLIDKYFGQLKSKEIPNFSFNYDEKLNDDKEKDLVMEKGGEFSDYFYRYDDKENTNKYKFVVKVLNRFLYNKLILNQKVNRCSGYLQNLEDYNFFYLDIYPLDGQSMETAKKIVLDEIKEFCSGNFDDYFFNAEKNSMIYALRNIVEKPNLIADDIIDIYSLNKNYQVVTDERIYLINDFTKKDVIEYANKLLKNRYLCINKKTGNRDFPKINKNKVSKIEVNDDKKSVFRKDIEEKKVEDIKPQTFNFNEIINEIKINDHVSAYYTKQNKKKCFKIRFSFKYGKLNNKKLAFFENYVYFSKSKQCTFNDFNNKVIELGSSSNLIVCDDVTEFEIKGLVENFEKTLMLIGEYFLNIEFDDLCIEQGTKRILNNFYYWKGNQILYKNYKDFLNTSVDIRSITKDDIKNLSNNILSANCNIIFDSSDNYDKIIEIIKKSGIISKCEKEFKYKKVKYNVPSNDKIYVSNFVGSQNVWCYFYSILSKLKINDEVLLDFFNEYVHNIIWNKTREQTGLTYSSEWTVCKNNKFHNKDLEFVFFDTQSGKLNDTFDTVFNLIKNFDKDYENYKLIEEKIKNTYNAKRYDDWDILNLYLKDLEEGVNVKKTNSHEIYGEKMNDMSLERLMSFYNKNLKNNPKDIFITGNIEKMDVNNFSKYGKVEIL